MAAAPSPLLVMDSVVKRFGSTVALDGVDLTVAAGEVHALIGENGAGKSTLMKILAGAHRPDEGRILLGGEPHAPASPLEARRAGIGMIYQELNLAPHLSVEANILLGVEESRFGLVRRRRHDARVREALAILGHGEIDPRAPVSTLGMGEKQIVEIARAIACKARIFVLDEPTSSLAHDDTERLFKVVRRLRDEGMSVIYISHFLDEIFRVADRFTVLRNGRTAGTGEISNVIASDVVELMVGRSLAELFPRVPHEPGEPILRVRELSSTPLPNHIELELRRGEILGVAGLLGSGRTETLRAIYGLEPMTNGRITIAEATDGGAPPHARVSQGIGFLSEDRKDEGLALDRSIADNVTLSRLEKVARFGWIRSSKERRMVEGWVERVGIHCRSVAQPVGDLSGGNQQKVALARLLHQEADVFLLDEPTRGIDIGSKVAVYQLMGELAAKGKAILFVSSYFPELLGVADRIAVVSRGRIRDVREARKWTERSMLLLAASGGES
ncbi:MAG TPA: sugar ABC transporter ATP-binding protein [Planctomycetota bacterium]|nr:sugar ABC transporter ATP-binding protein [Planctomycetota bacterium]